MTRHLAILVGATILIIVFESVAKFVLHWLYLLLHWVNAVLGTVFAGTQLAYWLKRILLILFFTGLLTGGYALINKALDHKLPFKRISIMWTSWIILIMTLVLKP